MIIISNTTSTTIRWGGGIGERGGQSPAEAAWSFIISNTTITTTTTSGSNLYSTFQDTH